MAHGKLGQVNQIFIHTPLELLKSWCNGPCWPDLVCKYKILLRRAFFIDHFSINFFWAKLTWPILDICFCTLRREICITIWAKWLGPFFHRLLQDFGPCMRKNVFTIIFVIISSFILANKIEIGPSRLGPLLNVVTHMLIFGLALLL